jgi:hypothetical protein
MNDRKPFPVLPASSHVINDPVFEHEAPNVAIINKFVLKEFLKMRPSAF